MAPRSLLRGLAAAALACSFVAPSSAQQFSSERILSGLSSPVFVTAPDGDSRLFILQQGGLIRIFDGNSVLGTPFLNIDPITNGGGERGLLGMAFHPDYANNGRFFVSYTTNGGASRVAEYAVSSSNPDVANSTQVQTIFSQSQPFSNHNGGCIKFGPDGKLYIAMGDGGSANDPGNRSQNPTTNLGKMIRLDVDIPSPFIPADNPFVGVAGTNDEIWALGVRNPWRFSFDRLTGDMWMGDVGQGAREEVNFQPANSPGGENYGWRCMEGFNCTGLSGCICNSSSLVLPIHDYTHGGGNCSITGGYVYRGTSIDGLQGTYFFADFCSNRIWSLRYDGMAVSEFTNRTTQLDPPVGNINNISSFGEDGFGELYIVDIGGEIFKLVPECGTSNYCTAAPNSATGGAAIGSNGDVSVASNSFELNVNGGVPGQFGIFFYGAAQTNGTPFGDGFLCVNAGGVGLFRLNPPQTMDFFGDAFRAVDFNSPPGVDGTITPGSRWFFQWWYRDPAAGGTGFNLSDGLDVLFCP